MQQGWTLAGILLAALTTATPAGADDGKFTTKGYYVETAVTSAFDVAVVMLGGPYKTKAACKAALHALPADQQPHASCHFEKKDPNEDP
jgi:hypothetical protein